MNGSFANLMRNLLAAALPVVLLMAAMGCQSGDDIATISASTQPPTAPDSSSVPAPAGSSTPDTSTASQGRGGVTVKTSGNSANPHPTMTIAQLRESQRQAALAEENYFTVNGQYTTRVTDLESNGYQLPPNLDMSIPEANAMSYCIQAFDVGNPGYVWHMSNSEGEPRAGSCP